MCEVEEKTGDGRDLQGVAPIKRRVHIFDNGVRVYDDHLWPIQRDRYRARNVHEAEEEDLFVELVGRIPPGGSFVDIGSAIGYYLLLAKRLRPDLQVHGVEPLAPHRQWFLDNLALNGLSPGEFTVHEEAISSSDGVVTFLEEGYGSAVRKAEKRAEGSRLRDIPAITLDHLVRRMGGHVDLCQMDVQGHEADVLRGGERSLRSAAISTLLIGTHGPRLHTRCIDLLKDYGYEIRHDVREPREQPDGILIAYR